MHILVECARSDVRDEDIAYLVKACVIGDSIMWTPGEHSADVASTGSPSSLTTLICPLYLRAFGYKVPKLGVAGRPAGGIDVLAQIPGFKFDLTDFEAKTVMQRAGYVHFLASKEHAIHDALLFDYRKKVNALDVVPLVIASLLSKKLLVGLSRVGLDVRVAQFGNFGATWSDARLNARRFCRVSRIVGIAAFCFLTDAGVPYQPYVGRGESLAALAEIFEDRSSPELNDHLQLCYAIAQGTSEYEIERPTPVQLGRYFKENIEAQGASIDNFFEKASSVIREHQFVLTASNSGFLRIDISALREIIVRYQGKAITEADKFPDPIGVILKSSYGAHVDRGQALATVRVEEAHWHSLQAEFATAFDVSPEDPAYTLKEIKHPGGLSPSGVKAAFERVTDYE